MKTLLLAVLIILANLLPAQTPVIRMVPSQTGPHNISDNIDIQVWIDNYTDLHGYHIVVLFNKSVVNFRSPAVVQNPSFFSPHSAPLFSTTYPDSLKCDAAILGTGGVSGASGLVFTIQLQATGDGSTDLPMIQTELRDSLNQSIAHTTQKSVISVASPLPDNIHTEAFRGISSNPNPDWITFGTTKARIDFDNTGAGGTQSAAHYETEPPGGSMAPFNPDPDGEVSSPIVAPRYWELITSIGGTSYYAKVAFSYDGIPGILDPQKLRIVYRSVSAGAGDTWTFIPKSQTQVVEVDKEIIITGQFGSQTFTHGQFTIVGILATVDVKVYLEGPYDADGDSMRTDINAGIPLAHPYSNSPWNYQSFSVSSIPDSIVDWVLVAIRSDTPASSAVDSTVGFLTRTGMIVDTSGSGPIKFDAAAGDYFIVVHHRNHLTVMSAAKQTLSSSTIYDFTASRSQFFGGDAAMLETGVYGMYGGDGQADGDTDASDINLVWRPQNGTGWLYTKYGDYDMDGDIDASDINLVWRPNNGKGTQVPLNMVVSPSPKNQER